MDYRTSNALANEQRAEEENILAQGCSPRYSQYAAGAMMCNAIWAAADIWAEESRQTGLAGLPL